MDAYKLSESEKESAVNGYLMSLAVFATTMPIPIINLIANIIYYIRRRKSTYLSRWHSMNAFVSQLPLFFINSFTWYSVWHVLWDDWQLNDYLIAYYVLAAILNVAEILLSIVCCLKIKKNKEVNWIMISPLCHMLCGKKSWDVWQRSWVPADPVYEKLAQEAQPKFVRDVAVSVGSLLLVFLLVSFGLSRKNYEYPNVSLFPVIEESIYDRYVNGHEVDEDKATEALRKCVSHICQKNGFDTVNVYLVKSNQVNAFAYCGRNLVVFSKLVETCETENELLAVIGHELGHIECDHVRKSVKKNVGISLIFSAFFGNTSSIMTEMTTNHLSRKAEREADTLSVRYLYNADIDPSGFASFMNKLLSGTIIDDIGFFSDHPATQERIDRSREQVARLAPKKYMTVMSEAEWKEFKSLTSYAGTKPYRINRKSTDFDIDVDEDSSEEESSEEEGSDEEESDGDAHIE